MIRPLHMEDGMQTNRFSVLRAVILVLALPAVIHAADLIFSVNDFSMSTNRQRGYLAGQQARVYVRVVRPGGEIYHGLPDRAPSGLRLEAGTKDAQGFRPDLMWTQQLAPVHYVDALRERADSLARRSRTPIGSDGDESYLGEFYQFTVTFPHVAGPDKVCLRAIFDHPEFGHMESKLQCLNIYPAQTEYDTHLLWSSIIEAAYDRNEPQRVIALADSFVTLGFVDPDWMDIAKTSAREHGEFEKALRYLDLNWQVNGITDKSQLRDWDGQRLPDSDRRQRDYDRQRNDLLAKTGKK
jgi:hypothetical protein